MGMYINIQKTDCIYLKILCNSVIFCHRGHIFLLALYISTLLKNGPVSFPKRFCADK